MPAMVLTANRLHDGEVIYLTAELKWSESLQDALTSEDACEQGRMTTLGDNAVDELVLVEPYLMPVICEDGRLLPTSQREIIRAAGPSVRLDLGKQTGPDQAERGASAHV